MGEKALRVSAIILGVIILAITCNLYATYGNTPSQAAERWSNEVTTAYRSENLRTVVDKNVSVEQEKKVRILANEVALSLKYGDVEMSVYAKDDCGVTASAFNHTINPSPYCDLIRQAYAEMIVYDILQTATAFDGKYYTPTQINLKNAGKEYQFTVDEEGVITKQKI